MMRFMTLLAFALITQQATASADQGAWNLPTSLNDDNCQVRFEVDSTWHLIKGRTKTLTGRAWLAQHNDPLSVRAHLELPVKEFDTDSSSRDERLREIMSAENFPKVLFDLTSIERLCNPREVTVEHSCEALAHGQLTIRGVRRNVQIPLVVKRAEQHYTIDGQVAFAWADFGVEDPSILIAKLDPTVTVSLSMVL